MAESLVELVASAFDGFTDAEVKTARNLFNMQPKKLRVLVSLLEAKRAARPRAHRRYSVRLNKGN